MDFDEDEVLLVEVKRLSEFSFDYVHDQLAKCNDKIRKNDPEGAFTNARTLLESVCLYTVEEREFVQDAQIGGRPSLDECGPIRFAEPKKDTHRYYEYRSLASQSCATRRATHTERHRHQTFLIDDRHAIFVVNLARSLSEYLFLSFIKAKDLNTAN